MALQIPAAQVPFIRRYFRLLDTLAENTPPGENLQIDRDLLATLTDEQLEGFKRLIASLQRNPPGGIRNALVSQQAEGLRRFFSDRENPDEYVQFFKDRTAAQIPQILDSLDGVLEFLAGVGLNQPGDLEHVIELMPILSSISSLILLWDNLNAIGPNGIQQLNELFKTIAGTENIQVSDATKVGQILFHFMAMTPEQRVALRNRMLQFARGLNESKRAHGRLRMDTGLGNNNLRAMTDYLGFSAPTGGKRKAKKTRKLRK